MLGLKRRWGTISVAIFLSIQPGSMKNSTFFVPVPFQISLAISYMISFCGTVITIFTFAQKLFWGLKKPDSRVYLISWFFILRQIISLKLEWHGLQEIFRLFMQTFAIVSWKCQVFSIYFVRLLKVESRSRTGTMYRCVSIWLYLWVTSDLLCWHSRLLCLFLLMLHFGPHFVMLNLGVTLKERAPDARGTPVDVGLSKVKP